MRVAPESFPIIERALAEYLTQPRLGDAEFAQQYPPNAETVASSKYPSFDEALSRFRAFAREHNLPATVAFVLPDNALVMRTRHYFR